MRVLFPALLLAAVGCQLDTPTDATVEFDASVPMSAIGWDADADHGEPLPPPSFDLTADPSWESGVPGDLWIDGMDPFTDVVILGTLAGPGRVCPGPLGGECLEISAPVKVVSSTRTDGAGSAMVSLRIPLPDGTTVWLEAASPGDPGRVSNVVEITLGAGECGGYEHPSLGGCWYNGAEGESCDSVCADHGGYDAAGSTHSGNDLGFHFWPSKADGGDWEEVECSSTDNNTNWGANGGAPDGGWTHGACHLSCSCMM